MKEDELRKLWQDDKNWGHGLFGGYFCKQDPRLIVPKRKLPGGTFNLAHRLAIPFLTGLIVLLVMLVVVFAFLACGSRLWL